MPWQYMDGQQVWIPEEGQPTAPGDWFGNFLSSFFRKDNKEQQPDSTVPAPFDPLRFYTTGTNQDRINFLTNLGLTYGGGEAGTAVWVSPSGERIPESAIVQGIMEGSFKGVPPAKTTATGGSSVPSYVYAAQAANYQASADLARAQAANIPMAQELERQKLIAAEQARKFGQGAQIIGLQTNNQDLANRGSQIVFEQSNVASQAQNRIQELVLQQQNLQSQYNFNASAANAAAENAVSQFNAQMGFNVEQANVAAQQRKQEQLQSLARDISEAAKAPGDYGKLAALTLANTGWGQAGTAIGRGEDLRTEQSLAPLESQLRTRKDVMAQPDRPFTYTPVTASMVQAPVVPSVNVGAFAIPKPTLTQQDVKQQQQQNALNIANLGVGNGGMSSGQYMNTLAGALQSGASSDSVNAALNAAIAAQTGAPTGYQGGGGEGGGTTAAATGGVVQRYADGGVNDSGEFNPIAVYEMLRKGGSSEQQAADMINAIMRSDQALQANTAAQQAQQQPINIEQVATQMPPTMYRQRYSEPPNYEQTEAELLRLGMFNPYQQPSGYDEGDTAGNVAGWTPQAMGNNAWQARKERFDSDFTALKSGQINGQEFENRNKDLDDNQFLQLTRLYGIPAAGSAALVAGAAVPSFFKWLGKGTQRTYLPLQQPAQIPWSEYPGYVGTQSPQQAQYRFSVSPGPLSQQPGYGTSWRFSPMDLENAASALAGKNSSLYANGGVANGAYISGERGPELNIPLGDKTIVLNQKQMKAAGIDLKKLMAGSKKPEQFAQGGVFDQGWGNVTDPDRTMALDFLNDALAKARAGTPWQQGNLPSPVYASSPGFSPIVSQVLGSLTSMAQGVPTEYFQELASKYAPSGMTQGFARVGAIQRSA